MMKLIGIILIAGATLAPAVNPLALLLTPSVGLIGVAFLMEN